MTNYSHRNFDARYWSWARKHGVSNDELLLLTYLWTSTTTNFSGLYIFKMKTLSAMIQLEYDQVLYLLGRLKERGLIDYLEDSRLIWMKGMEMLGLVTSKQRSVTAGHIVRLKNLVKQQPQALDLIQRFVKENKLEQLVKNQEALLRGKIVETIK